MIHMYKVIKNLCYYLSYVSYVNVTVIIVLFLRQEENKNQLSTSLPSLYDD